MRNSKLIGATMSQIRESRRSERFPSDALTGSATTIEGSIPIALTNISRDGFSAITDRLVPVDRPILIEVASILREARIVRQNDVTIGAEFVTPPTQGEPQEILSGSPPTI